MEELSELMGNETFLSEIENSEHVFSELRRQVKKSNEVLQSLEPGTLLSKLSGLLTPPDIQENISENFVGLEAGRLEVEKARLELELTAARQRLQELELSGRNSMARSEVMSGLGGDISGEPNISNLDLETFHDLRERASRILSEQEEGNQDKPPEVINVLGELLLYCDQVSKSAKVQTLDLSQQLEAADKQLKATRQFLEEQAQERETEREEWERKIAAVRLQSTRHREEESVGFENEVREDADSEDASPSTSSEEKRELASAVDKIFQLREIIRTLETDIRQRAEAEKTSRAEVQELRTVLADALMGQQAIQEELELARSSSTDQDMIDLIEGLKDQLGSKTQELKAHRAAHQHLHDVKAHLRGLQERVVQSTRELNNSVAGGKSSANSSRGSSPLNIHPNGGSFEDIGVGGLEIEEVSRLERKLKILEVAEAATLNKIKRMEDEIQSLNAEKAKLSSRVEEMDKKSATTDLKMKKLKEENVLLEKELKDLRNHNFDDLQAENNLLQERMVSLQVQVSTLQGERQASKHRIPSSQGLELAIQEKEKILHQLDDTSARLEAAITEKDLLQRRCSGLVSKVAQLEMDLEAQGAVDDTPVDVVGALRRDKAELEEVNQKLLKEVSHARAAELAAHKVQMPKLAEDLLKEKNLEIDSLRSQLSDITSKTTNPLHSTPNSWSSNISKASVEQLRDAPVHTSHLPDLSFVVGRRDVCISTGKSSAPNLDPIQEFPDSSFNLRQGCLDGNRSLVENGERSNVAVSCVDGSGGLSATQSGTHEVMSPEVEITRRTEKQELGDEHTLNENLAELEELLSQKLSEIETLSAAVHEKESQIFDLQDRVNDFEEKLADVKNEAAEKNKLCSSLGDIIEKKDDNISSLTDNLQTCRDQLRQLQDEAMKDASPDLREEIKRLREEVSDRVQGMENIHAILQNNELEIKSRLKTEEDLKNKLSGAENEIAQLLIKTRQLSLDNLDLQSIKDSAEKKQEDLITAKRTLEEELTTVKREMSSIETVVKEMTGQFKQEVQSRENELENVKATLLLAQNSESVLSSKCTELEIDLNDAKMKLNLAQTQLSTKEFELNEQKNSTKKDELMPIEVGSLDDLTNLVQRELDISSDLDQTLLTQLVSGNSSFNTTGGGATEVQRLARKVQKDGVRVLSLSERLFLTQHTNEEKPRPADNDTKFRDIERQLELLQFEVEQERIVSHDYKHALESEKKNGLDIISKLSRERQLRSELEEELSVVQRQVRLLNKEKMKRLPSLVDSDNEEFLHTIQTQRQQIESLEDSLKLEKENFAHLQNVLTVERRRGRQEESSEERRNEDDISELRNQLRSERSYREKLESSLGGGKSGEVAKLIIGRLHSELEAERRRNCQLSVQLEREKKKYFDVYQEYKYKKSESIEKSAEGVGLDESWTRVWRTRELELERLVAELEMKVEVLQLEEGRTRQQVENLQIELNYERENNNSGLSKEQLARMRQVNAFLEHNLKENGEMLSTITRLQEDKQELKTKLGDSNRRLETCSCSTQPEDKTNVYSKFLRAESYRKALIWQKRYLLVQLSGGYFEKDPVLKVGQQNLFGLSRFKAAVHAVISIKRMKYLVDRWRSGKRSGLRPRAWSTVRGTAVSEINVGRSSSSQRRPDTLSLHSPVSQSVLSPRVEGTRGRAGVRRSSSLREKPMGRSLESPSSVSSTSSIFHPPVITGRTPPTRDVAGRRQVRASDPGSMEPVQEGFQARRSLGTQFKDGNFSSLRDPDLAADLKDYLDKFQTLEKQLGVKF